MPEGDTVWRAGRRLDEALAGRTLTRADLRVPALATVGLQGRSVLEVATRGKHLLMRVAGTDDDPADAWTLHSHLRMDGAWHRYRPGTRWRGGPDHQVRAVLANQDWEVVGYRLPVLELVPTIDEDRAVGHLGPDLLDPAPDLAEAVRRLTADPQRPIAEALLDQRAVAGIGNLYKCEVLFLRGVSPWRPVGQVDDLPGLVGLARRLLDANRWRPEQITTGDTRRGARHWVFERAGRPCRRCRGTIRSARQGTAPYDRVTYWCPRCQR